jgi:hypothetical protein
MYTFPSTFRLAPPFQLRAAIQPAEGVELFRCQSLTSVAYQDIQLLPKDLGLILKLGYQSIGLGGSLVMETEACQDVSELLELA